MNNGQNCKPPGVVMAIFRWFCRPGLHEEIEGDLLEQFHRHSELYGLKKARMYFIKNVILLFNPAIIGNFHHLTFSQLSNMKSSHWLRLAAVNMLVILCIILPFIPRPSNRLVVGLSIAAQVIGFASLLLVPVGILWLMQQIKQRAGNVSIKGNWSTGYYYAITTTIYCTFICLFLVIPLGIFSGELIVVISILVIAFCLARLIPAIKKMKQPGKKLFNPVPLYLLSIPIIAFVARMVLMEPVSDFSRNYTIGQSQSLLNSIENYYTKKGYYPESMNDLQHIARPSIMGITKFNYERTNDGYNLSFVQWQHVEATEEVVMYS